MSTYVDPYSLLTYPSREIVLFIENDEPMYNHLARVEQRCAKTWAHVLTPGGTVDTWDVRYMLPRFVSMTSSAIAEYRRQVGRAVTTFGKADKYAAATFLRDDFLDRMVSGQGPTEPTFGN